MEPTTQPPITQPTASSSWSIPAITIGVLFVLALCAAFYFYYQSISPRPVSVLQNETSPKENTTVPATTQQETSTATLQGPVMNSVYVRDSASFEFFDDSKNKWIVNYKNSNFAEYSYTSGKVKGTDGLLGTTLETWIKMQKRVGDPEDVTGAPGVVKITGTFQNGIFYASSIRVEGQ